MAASSTASYNLKEIRLRITPDVDTLLNPERSAEFIIDGLDFESKRCGIILIDLVNQLTEDPEYEALIFEALWTKRKVESYNQMLTYLSQTGFTNLVNKILEAKKHNKDIVLEEDDYDLAMMLAAEEGHMDIVRLMLDSGAKNYDSAMNTAARGGQMEIVKLMVEKGGTRYNSAMMAASAGGHMDVVRLMLKLGATYYNSAMRFAAEEGHIEIVKLMLEKGATHYDKAMARAAFGGHMEIVKLMLEYGATNYDRAIFLATGGGYFDIHNYIERWLEEHPQ